MDDGVDVLLGDDLGDDRIPDVGSDERHITDVAAWRNNIDSDDAVDGRIAGRGARKSASEVTRDSRDQHDPSHDRSYLPSLRRWTRVFFKSLRCFFLAIRLRRFLMTEPT